MCKSKTLPLATDLRYYALDLNFHMYTSALPNLIKCATRIETNSVQLFAAHTTNDGTCYNNAPLTADEPHPLLRFGMQWPPRCTHPNSTATATASAFVLMFAVHLS
jgi:hypothetical protein